MENPSLIMCASFAALQQHSCVIFFHHCENTEECNNKYCCYEDGWRRVMVAETGEKGSVTMLWENHSSQWDGNFCLFFPTVIICALNSSSCRSKQQASCSLLLRLRERHGFIIINHIDIMLTVYRLTFNSQSHYNYYYYTMDLQINFFSQAIKHTRVQLFMRRK